MSFSQTSTTLQQEKEKQKILEIENNATCLVSLLPEKKGKCARTLVESVLNEARVHLHVHYFLVHKYTLDFTGNHN